MKKILTLIIFAVLLIAPAYVGEWVEVSSDVYILQDRIKYNYEYKFVDFWFKTIATPPYKKINGREIRETQMFVTLDCKTSSLSANSAMYIGVDGVVLGVIPSINPYSLSAKINTDSLGSIGYYLCKEVNSKQEE